MSIVAGANFDLWAVSDAEVVAIGRCYFLPYPCHCLLVNTELYCFVTEVLTPKWAVAGAAEPVRQGRLIPCAEKPPIFRTTFYDLMSSN